MDVAMNSCGVIAEIVANRPLMGSFHGSYSIAAAIAALLGSSLSAIGWYICRLACWRLSVIYMYLSVWQQY